jgi:hypothetical protein
MQQYKVALIDPSVCCFSGHCRLQQLQKVVVTNKRLCSMTSRGPAPSLLRRNWNFKVQSHKKCVIIDTGTAKNKPPKNRAHGKGQEHHEEAGRQACMCIHRCMHEITAPTSTNRSRTQLIASAILFCLLALSHDLLFVVASGFLPCRIRNTFQDVHPGSSRPKKSVTSTGQEPRIHHERKISHLQEYAIKQNLKFEGGRTGATDQSVWTVVLKFKTSSRCTCTNPL